MLTLVNLAEELSFGIIKTEKDLLKRIKGQWEYRKGKTISDINDAMRKGLKLGAGKTEWEIDGIALYLQDVFKKVR